MYSVASVLMQRTVSHINHKFDSWKKVWTITISYISMLEMINILAARDVSYKTKIQINQHEMHMGLQFLHYKKSGCIENETLIHMVHKRHNKRISMAKSLLDLVELVIINISDHFQFLYVHQVVLPIITSNSNILDY